jgi:hypothetical protein
MTCSTYGNGNVTENVQLEANECCVCVAAEMCVLSTGQEMILVRKAVDAHAEHFVVNDELLVPILNKQSCSAHAQYTLLEILEFSAGHSYQYGSVVPAPTITTTTPLTPQPEGVHLVVCSLHLSL